MIQFLRASDQQRIKLLASVASTALLLSLYYGTFGSIEPEENQHISYSIAAGTSVNGAFEGPRRVGTFSNFGIPLYDGLQGIGQRLPYKGAWLSSVEWPLRMVLDWQMYVLVRVFITTISFLLLAVSAIRSWRPELSGVKTWFLQVLLVSPAPLYLRYNEWSDTWSQNAAVAGIAMFFLNKRYFEDVSQRGEGFFARYWSCVPLFVCLSHLIAGHPGGLPNAFFLLAPLAVCLILFVSTARLRLAATFRSQRVQIALLVLPPALLLSAVSLDIRVESLGVGDWTEQRSGGWPYGPDQAFLGFSRGVLPTELERFASVVFSLALQPVAPLLWRLLSPMDFVIRTSGWMTWGGFSGLLAVLLAMVNLRRQHKGSPIRNLAVVLVMTQVVMHLFVWLASTSRLPTFLLPSGGWTAYSEALPLNILLTVVLLGPLAVVTRLTRLFLVGNLGLVLVYVLVMFGFVTPAGEVTKPENYDLAISTEEIAQLPGDQRTALIALTISGDDDTMLYARSFFIPMSGKSLLQSAATMRDTNQMRAHTAIDGGYTQWWVRNRTLKEVDATLSFLQVGRSLVQFDEAGRDFYEQVKVELGLGAMDAGQDARLTFRGFEYQVWVRRTGFSDVVLTNNLSNNDKCPILEKSCPILVETVPTNVQSTPKLKVCLDPCLWQYESGSLNQGEVLVIPVGYDPTLVVKTAEGVSLSTVETAGFLGVRGSQLTDPQTLTITVGPDWRMNLYVLSSYITITCFLVLTVLGIRQSQKRKDILSEPAEVIRNDLVQPERGA